MEEVMFDPSPANYIVSSIIVARWGSDLLALYDHHCFQDWYELVGRSSPELPVAFAIPVLPKVNPHLR
jgi:hypothetical protein